MGQAWHGRAVAKGRVARGRAESCKRIALRVGRMIPLARERSHVILVRRIIRRIARGLQFLLDIPVAEKSDSRIA